MELSVAILVVAVFVIAFVWALASSADAFFAVTDPIIEAIENLGKMAVEGWRVYIRGIEMTGKFFANITRIRFHYVKPAPIFPPPSRWGDEQRSLQLEQEVGLAFDDNGLLLSGYHHEKHVQMMIEVAPGLCAEHLVRVLCAEEDGTLRFPNGEALILEKPIPMSDAKPYLAMSTPISSRTDPGVDLPGRRTRRMQSGDWPRLIGLADMMDFDEHRREEI